MDTGLIKRQKKRLSRALRVRKHLKGTATKPRLSVHKSNRHIAVQLIDDEAAVTLLSVNTMMKDFRGKGLKKSKESARLIGSKIATLAQEKNIVTIVFDRGRYKYHGLIAELAQAARAGGLQF